MIVDPDRQIVDPHHHLVEEGHEWGRYLLPDLQADTTAGHRVVQTVYAECARHYYTGGPEHLRPVGETEWVASVARESAVAAAGGHGAEIAGIIAHADLTLVTSSTKLSGSFSARPPAPSTTRPCAGF